MSFITLSKSNYFYNLDKISQNLESKNQIAVVLKDNAYGHGLEEMALLSAEYGIKRVVVKNCQEALKIHNLFENILILFPNIKKIKNIEECSKKNFVFSVPSKEKIQEYIDLNIEFNIALKIDSGMHRSGVDFEDLEESILNIIESKKLKLREIFTHFRESDELSSSLFWQRENFKKIKKIAQKIISENNREMPTFHSNNSAGVFRTKNKISDEVVRVGIAIYGYLIDTKNKSFMFPKLKPVLSVWGEKIGETRKSQNGFRVGYGGICELEKDVSVSIYDFGYADGFKRFSDDFLKKDKFLTPENIELCGRISMDSSAFKTDKKELMIFNNVSRLAKIFGTIEYEILVSLNFAIPKRVID